MYPIDNSSAVTPQPDRGPAEGAKFFALNGATRVDDWWLNMVQNELQAVVEAAALTIDKDDDTQVLEAIRALIAGPDNPINNYALFEHRTTSGTSGGTPTVGANVRTLTQMNNSISGLSLSGNQVTFPAGKYRVVGHCVGFNGSSSSCTHKALLYNTGDTTYTVAGTNAYARDDNAMDSMFEGEFTIASEKIFELHSYFSAAPTGALGYAMSIPSVDEVYAKLSILKIA